MREKARKETALADIHEAELARLRGELVDLDFMEEQTDRLVAATAGAVLRQLMDAKVIKPRMERRVRRLLEDQLEELLTALQSAGDRVDDDDESNANDTTPADLRNREDQLVA